MITYRHTLVGCRAAIKNNTRSILDRHGLQWPSGQSGWKQRTLKSLDQHTTPVEAVASDELWKAQVFLEREALAHMESLIEQVEEELDDLAESDMRVRQLRAISWLRANRATEA